MRSIAGRSNGRICVVFYTYVLKSELDGKLYIGWTSNLKVRVDLHNRGKVDSTKNRLPFKADLL